MAAPGFTKFAMETITLKLFEFDELSQAAKGKALNRFGNINVTEDWYQFSFENFVELTARFGLNVRAKDIHFRGFNSQGDGSAFAASVNLPALIDYLATQEWKREYPELKLELNLPELDKRVLKLILDNKMIIDATIKQSAGTYQVTAETTMNTNYIPHEYNRIEGEIETLEAWLQQTAISSTNCYINPSRMNMTI